MAPPPVRGRATRRLAAGLSGALLLSTFLLVDRGSADEPTAPAPSWTTTSVTPPHLPAPLLDRCGNQLDTVDLRAEPQQERTGIRVLAGAGMEIDLDTGQIREPLVTLGDDEKVQAQTRIGDVTYLTIAPCETGANRVLRIDPDGRVAAERLPLAEDERFQYIVGTDNGPLMGLFDTVTQTVSYQDLDGSPLIALPEGFTPYWWADTTVTGITRLTEGPNGPAELQEYDRNSGEATTLATFAPGDRGVIALDGDRALWATAATDDAPASVTERLTATGGTTTVDWDFPDDFAIAASSRDGDFLVGSIPAPDETLTADGGSSYRWPPVTYQLLDLDTGEVTEIPGLESVPGLLSSSLAVAFSSAGDRIVVAARSVEGIRFYTWTPGEPALQASPVVVPLDRMPSAGIFVLPTTA